MNFDRIVLFFGLISFFPTQASLSPEHIARLANKKLALAVEIPKKDASNVKLGDEIAKNGIHLSRKQKLCLEKQLATDKASLGKLVALETQTVKDLENARNLFLPIKHRTIDEIRQAQEEDFKRYHGKNVGERYQKVNSREFREIALHNVIAIKQASAFKNYISLVQRLPTEIAESIVAYELVNCRWAKQGVTSQELVERFQEEDFDYLLAPGSNGIASHIVYVTTGRMGLAVQELEKLEA
jgi:hypothetical protein